MKKISFLCAALFIFVLSARAQLEQGTKNIGGTLTYEGNSNGTSTTTFLFQPEFNYFVADKLSVGGSIGFSSQKVTETTNMFLLGVNGRQHFTLSETVTWFIQGGINFGVGGDDNSSITSYGIAFRPGFLLFLTPKVGLEAGFGSLGYQAFSVKPDGGSTSTTSTYGLSLNSNSLFFGFRYYFK